MRTVSQLLASKTKCFNTIEPGALVIDGLNRVSSTNISYLVVMQGKEYKGIFSERDYCRNVVLKGLTSGTATVAEVMTPDFPVVSIDDSIEHCLKTMNNFKTRYLLVFNGDLFIDVITIHDLLRQVLFNREKVFDGALTKSLIDTHERCLVY